jgi:tetratricopeptide (TPR) repeat protein
MFENFEIAWNQFQENPDLLHQAVAEWEENGINDPAILGLIDRYHFHNGDVAMVMQDIQILRSRWKNPQSVAHQRNRMWPAAAAIGALLLGLGGWLSLQQNKRPTWSYHDAGIPQYMDEKMGSIDWATINYCYQNGDYSEMLQKIEASAGSEYKNDTILYYKAIAYLELEERDSALKFFQMVPQGNSVYGLKSQYFIFHLEKGGPNYKALGDMQIKEDPILKQAIQTDIAR